MNQLTLTITTQREARCPICNETLQRNCFRFVNSIAYCWSCAEASGTGLHAVTEAHFATEAAAPLLTQANGLTFWTPAAHVHRRAAAWIIISELMAPVQHR
jgi:hypothetical protein